MSNLQLPNPSTPSDQASLIRQTLNAVRLLSPNPSVVASVPASTTYTYVVVAKSNGVVVPGSATITTGSASLSTADFNTITWPQVPMYEVTYDVYRTAGGPSQGLIAADLQVNSLVDPGIPAVTQTAPSFNTSGVLNLSTVSKYQNLATSGAITLLSGIIFLSGSGVVAATLPLPAAGTPESGGQDGARLTIISTTAHAHTVTTPANGVNGADHVVTFSGTLPNSIELVALGGTWNTVNNVGGTIS